MHGDQMDRGLELAELMLQQRMAEQQAIGLQHADAATTAVRGSAA